MPDDAGADSPYELRVQDVARAFPFHRRAYLAWRDQHRLTLRALEAMLVSRLGLTGDQPSIVHETLREML